MPLLPGKMGLGKNISELMSGGRPKKQAIAIAMDKVKTRPKSMSTPMKNKARSMITDIKSKSKAVPKSTGSRSKAVPKTRTADSNYSIFKK